jgi:hypothetical protein
MTDMYFIISVRMAEEDNLSILRSSVVQLQLGMLFIQIFCITALTACCKFHKFEHSSVQERIWQILHPSWSLGNLSILFSSDGHQGIPYNHVDHDAALFLTFHSGIPDRKTGNYLWKLISSNGEHGDGGYRVIKRESVGEECTKLKWKCITTIYKFCKQGEHFRRLIAS